MRLLPALLRSGPNGIRTRATALKGRRPDLARRWGRSVRGYTRPPWKRPLTSPSGPVNHPPGLWTQMARVRLTIHPLHHVSEGAWWQCRAHAAS